MEVGSRCAGAASSKRSSNGSTAGKPKLSAKKPARNLEKKDKLQELIPGDIWYVEISHQVDVDSLYEWRVEHADTPTQRRE